MLYPLPPPPSSRCQTLMSSKHYHIVLLPPSPPSPPSPPPQLLAHIKHPVYFLSSIAWQATLKSGVNRSVMSEKVCSVLLCQIIAGSCAPHTNTAVKGSVGKFRTMQSIRMKRGECWKEGRGGAAVGEQHG